MRLDRSLCVLALALLGTVNAGANIITNGDFSSGTGINNRILAGQTSIVDWTVLSTDVDYIDSTVWQAPDGTTRTVDLAGFQPGGIQQTVPTIAGTIYTLSFYLAGNPDGAPTVKLLDVLASCDGTTFDSTNYTFDTTGYSRENMGWTLQSWQFTAVGSTTTLQFLDGYTGVKPTTLTSGTAWNSYGAVVGDINLEVAPPPPDHAPEPATMAMLGSGLIGLGYVYRRRRAR